MPKFPASPERLDAGRARAIQIERGAVEIPSREAEAWCCNDGAAEQFLFDGLGTKHRGRRANLASRRDIRSTGGAALAEAALASDYMDRMPPPGHRKVPR